MLLYSYTRTGTDSTTGYFACIPDPEPDLDQALELLARRPLDSFLHTYVLELLRNLAPAELVQRAAQCLGSARIGKDDRADAYAAALFLELASIEPAIAGILQSLLEDLRNTAMPIMQQLPFPAWLLASRETLKRNRILNAAYTENVHRHRPLVPGMRSGIASSGSRARGGASGDSPLARIHASLAKEPTPAESPVAPAQTYALALEALSKADLLEGPEMRHEASLSPIALLRNWRVSVSMRLADQEYSLSGLATAYGRGLSLWQARASCIMEIVERVSAYPDVEPGGEFGHGFLPQSGQSLLKRSLLEMESAGIAFVLPTASWDERIADLPLHWLKGEDPAGRQVWLPFQSVALFANLPEPTVADAPGSTGLGAGNSVAQARLAALLEVIERDAHATVPFDVKKCFVPWFRDARLQALLADYHARHIFPQFQDITTPVGVPVYRCFVQGRDGTIAQATGAGLNGMKAALSALTETPWPYVWATPAPFGSPSAAPPPGLAARCLEDLPAYELGSSSAELELLEKSLEALGCRIAYATLTRKDLGFPVVRAIVEGLAPNTDFDALNPPAQRFFEQL